MAMEEVLALNHGVASCCFSQCVLLIRHNRMPSSFTRPAPELAACNILHGTSGQHPPQGSRLWGLLQQLTQHLAIHAYRIGIQHAGHIGLRCFLLSLTTQGIT